MIQTKTTAPEIVDEFWRLSLMNEIPDPRAHAEEWRNLAIQCDVNDMPNMASNCISRVKYWHDIDRLAFIRLVEGSFSELIPVDALLTAEQAADTEEQ